MRIFQSLLNIFFFMFVIGSIFVHTKMIKDNRIVIEEIVNVTKNTVKILTSMVGSLKEVVK